ADFERAPDTFDLESYAALREWKPDILVLRICENTPEEKVDAFGEACLRLIRYFAGEGLRIFAVGPFWKHDRKEACIRALEDLPGVQYVTLKHLHSQAYQAIGLFAHAGVAGHPSDAGMEGIARAIFAAYRGLKVYPFPEGEPVSEAYTVQVSGMDVPVYTCRVSAMSFNRVWPGQQRPPEQTEMAAFVHFGMAVPQTIRVTLNRDFSEVTLRPLSRRIPVQTDGRTVTFTLTEPGQYSLEADGRHCNLHIFADPVTEDDRWANATYYYGPGVHEAGMITLRSGESLYIDAGAVVHGMVSAEDCGNIGIYGHGILDQSRYARDTYQSGIIRMTRCRNVEIRDVILRDSSAWTMTLVNCDGVECSGLKAIGMWRYNADGFDFCNCRNVHVTGCFLRNFDDVIVLKGLRLGTPSAELWNPENIVVEDCVLWCDWGGALEIGAETVADEYKNITFRNIDILRNDQGGLRIHSGDRAEIHDVLYENIRVEYSRYDRAPMYQHSDDMVYAPPEAFWVPDVVRVWMYCNMWTKDGILGHVHDITYRNIHIYTDEGMPMPACEFSGADGEHRVENIVIDGMYWNGEKVSPAVNTNQFSEEPLCR
ncbi:MAG: hypothetical protein IJX14_04965, partial [Clostridia bacterium]|nr:hypothetical protein [Clostridia bacterium]